MTYAGLEAKETPNNIIGAMRSVARAFDAMGYTVRCSSLLSPFSQTSSRKQIYPASKYATTDAIRLAKETNSSPITPRGIELELLARQAHIVFGADLRSPVDFVLCWTKDSAESHSERTSASSDIGQAISLASERDIPVINMSKPGWASKLRTLTGLMISGETLLSML